MYYLICVDLKISLIEKGMIVNVSKTLQNWKKNWTLYFSNILTRNMWTNQLHISFRNRVKLLRSSLAIFTITVQWVPCVDISHKTTHITSKTKTLLITLSQTSKWTWVPLTLQSDKVCSIIRLLHAACSRLRCVVGAAHILQRRWVLLLDRGLT